MATYAGASVSVLSGDDSARMELSGASWTGAAVAIQGGPAPFIDRLGSLAMNLGLATQNGRRDVSGDSWLVQRVTTLLAQLTGRLDLTGQVWVGRFIPISAVYRNADRVTLAGLAVDLAGNPLRQVQLQFIGLTVQDHFFGSGTDGNGIYVAYLDTGDSYDAYAFSPSRGQVFKLDHQTPGPNTTTLVFRLLTKRGGADGFGLKAA